MRYDVTLRIDYAYSQPTDHTRNLLRLLPVDIPGVQHILDWTMTLSPRPSEQRGFTDFFGNAVTAAAWHDPIEEVKIALAFRAERLDEPARLLLALPLDRLAGALAQERGAGPASPLHFTAPTRHVPLAAVMTAFARDAADPAGTVLDAIHAVGAAIHAHMTYKPDVTDVDTPALQAFQARAGVCQDYAHIMIACLRGIGVPAGYVSGFLRTFPPPGQEKLLGVDAMHAWVRAWAGPEVGWVEFDPTNNQPAGIDYITIGYGRDYDDVAPVRGAMRGAGAQTSKQSVDVLAIEDAEASR